jgi:hydroxymethylpyrimidine/phosphomethylpyrimidine kinase
MGVFNIHEIPTALVAQQIEVVLSDIGADVIKTGMLATVPMINAVADCLDRTALRIPRVVDPVMRAKGGHPLLADDAAKTLIARMVRGAAVVTPNLPEAEVLIGRSIKTITDMHAAVEPLKALGADAVLLKGGHLEGHHLVDMLITREGVKTYEDSRIETRSTHGTGCTLASAIAAGLAQKLSLQDAVSRARIYVRRALESAPGLGQGHGPLNHAHTVVNQ